MTSIILNVFSYLIWFLTPFRAIPICIHQPHPIWILPPRASPPPHRCHFTLLRVCHTPCSPPSPYLLCALTLRFGLSLGESPLHSGIALTLHPSCPPHTVEMCDTQARPFLCGATLLTLCRLCPPVPDSPPGWQMIFLHCQPDHVIHLCKILVRCLLPHGNIQTPQ